MSSRKVVPLEKELQDDELKKSIELIHMGLDSLDGGIDIETPSMDWFEQLVVEQKEVVRKKLWKEVTIFLSMALIIVSVLLYTLYQLPGIFLGLQVVATIFIVTYSVKGFSKQVDGA